MILAVQWALNTNGRQLSVTHLARMSRYRSSVRLASVVQVNLCRHQEVSCDRTAGVTSK